MSVDQHVIFKLGFFQKRSCLVPGCVWCACFGMHVEGARGVGLERQGGGFHAMALYAMLSQSCFILCKDQMVQKERRGYS